VARREREGHSVDLTLASGIMVDTNVGAFFEACAAGNVTALRTLLADDPALIHVEKPDEPHGGWTGLHTAARDGHVDAVRLLIEQGANVDAREAGDNTTPLHWAAADGQLETVRALLDAGADAQGLGDVHALDVIGWATFYHAPGADEGRMDPARGPLVSLLVERGARHHIFSAISVGDLDLIRRVVQRNPTALDRRLSRFEHGWTPVHLALNRRRYDILDLLIELGADLEATDDTGQTALAVAMLRGDHEAMRRLSAAGAKQPEPIDAATAAASLAILGDSVKKGVPMIYVPDVARALDWYSAIGFKELARYADHGLVNFGLVSFGSAELMLNMHGKPAPHDASLWFYTDQIESLYRVLKSRQLAAARAAMAEQPNGEGIEFEQDLEDMFYGARQFCIRDLNGYQLYFIQSTTSE
jgi:uncharacterized glyoxalase superfamily protein PhnB